MAKDFKLMGEAYTKIYEQIPSQPAAVATPENIQLGLNTIAQGAISDTAAADQAKKVFDTAAMTYLKALGVDEANIKKFIDMTHTQFSKGKPTTSTVTSSPNTSNYLPK